MILPLLSLMIIISHIKFIIIIYDYYLLYQLYYYLWLLFLTLTLLSFNFIITTIIFLVLRKNYWQVIHLSIGYAWFELTSNREDESTTYL